MSRVKCRVRGCGCGDSVSMSYTIGSGTGGATSKMSDVVKTPLEQTVNLSDFQAFMTNTYGLSTGQANNYTSNRVQVTSIPYVGIGAGGELVLTNGSATTYTVVVQRTTDFVTWSPVITTIVSPDLPIRFMDDNAPDDQGFYRTVTITPDTSVLIRPRLFTLPGFFYLYKSLHETPLLPKHHQ